MLVSVNQSELHKLKFVAKIERRLQIWYITASHGFASKNVQNRQSALKPVLWRVTEVACKCWWNVFRPFARFVFKCFCGFKKINERFWGLSVCRSHWCRILYYRCCSFIRHSPFRHFTIVKTIPDQPNSCPKICSLLSKSYDRPRMIDILLL